MAGYSEHCDESLSGLVTSGVSVITVMNHAQDSDQWRVIVSTVVNHSQDSDQWGFCDHCDESRSG